MPPSEDKSTDRIVAKTPRPGSGLDICGNYPCPYDDAQIKRWVEQKLSSSQKSELSFWWKAGMFIVPFLVSFFIWISNVDKRVTIVELRQSEISEIKQAVKDIQVELINLRIQIDRINNRGVNNAQP